MKKLLSLIAIASISFTALPDVVFADDTLRVGDTYDYPVMSLGRYIDSTQTNSIFTVPVVRNNAETTVPATSGAIVQLSRNGVAESIFASRVTVNTSTNVVTFTGTVIRDLCFNQARTFTTCGAGLSWTKGTEIRFVNSNRFYNSFVNARRPNALNASGALSFYGSGSLSLPTFASTAERDRQLGATPGGPVRTACVTGDACYYYLGGAWIKFGSGSSVSATTTVRGGVELTTPTDILNGTVTGDSGGPLVLPASIATRSSSGSTQANKIPALQAAGYLSGSLLGRGAHDANGFLRSDQKFMTGSTTQVLYGSGSFADLNAPTTNKLVFGTAGTSASTGTSIASIHYFSTGAYNIPANDLATGVRYRGTAVYEVIAATTKTAWVPCLDVGGKNLIQVGVGSQYGDPANSNGWFNISVGNYRFVVDYDIEAMGAAGATTPLYLTHEVDRDVATSGSGTLETNLSQLANPSQFGNNYQTVAANAVVQVKPCGKFQYAKSTNRAFLRSFILYKLFSTAF